MDYEIAKLLFWLTSQFLLKISMATLEANKNITPTLQGKHRFDSRLKIQMYINLTNSSQSTLITTIYLKIIRYLYIAE